MEEKNDLKKLNEILEKLKDSSTIFIKSETFNGGMILVIKTIDGNEVAFCFDKDHELKEIY